MLVNPFILSRRRRKNESRSSLKPVPVFGRDLRMKFIGMRGPLSLLMDTLHQHLVLLCLCLKQLREILDKMQLIGALEQTNICYRIFQRWVRTFISQPFHLRWSSYSWAVPTPESTVVPTSQSAYALGKDNHTLPYCVARQAGNSCPPLQQKSFI